MTAHSAVSKGEGERGEEEGDRRKEEEGEGGEGEEMGGKVEREEHWDGEGEEMVCSPSS